MTSCDSVVKYENHNVAYDRDTDTFDLGPTSKCKHNDTMLLSVSLHKWIGEGNNKGNYIAVLVLGDCDQKAKIDTFRALYNDRKSALFDDIERGILPENVEVFRFSVNAWRHVIFKKTKWAFDDTKPTKDEPSRLQQVLDI